ncbi:hypothetical protein STENM223S_10987 [Streptomyces tendae]
MANGTFHGERTYPLTLVSCGPAGPAQGAPNGPNRVDWSAENSTLPGRYLLPYFTRRGHSAGITGAPRVALSMFVPVPLFACLMAALESRLPAAEVSGVRSLTRLDNLLVLAVVGAAVLCSALVAVAEGSSGAVAGGRNAAFLTGLMLLGRAWTGQSAVMIPVGWLVTVVVVGFRGNVRTCGPSWRSPRTTCSRRALPCSCSPSA